MRCPSCVSTLFHHVTSVKKRWHTCARATNDKPHARNRRHRCKKKKKKKLTCSRNLNNKSRRVLKVSPVTEEDVALCDGGFMTLVPLCRWILQTPQRIAPSTHLVACLDQLTSSGTDGPRSSPATPLVPHRLHLLWRKQSQDDARNIKHASLVVDRFVARGWVMSSSWHFMVRLCVSYPPSCRRLSGRPASGLIWEIH